MTLDQIFGNNNAVATTVGGKTRISLNISYFNQITQGEANSSSGDIRKVAYGIIKGLADAIKKIKSVDNTLTNVTLNESYSDVYDTEDVVYSAIMTFGISASLQDVKDE
jgi:hypothetical protein